MKLKSVKQGSTVQLVYVCPTCNYSVKYENDKILEERVSEAENAVKVIGDNVDVSTLPTVNAVCPKCGNNKAYWWFVQTRSADEPPTQFYRCTKCGYTWRVYT